MLFLVVEQHFALLRDTIAAINTELQGLQLFETQEKPEWFQ